MIISIASGKGGTGKTTVATNLAAVAGENATFLDCDVEEPNGALFLKPYLDNTTTVTSLVPKRTDAPCTSCRECVDICRFGAITVVGRNPLIFPELCHGCGGCILICPEKCLTAGHKEIGVIESGKAGSIRFHHGLLKIGEAMAPPLIKELRKQFSQDSTVIIDAPPGTSCPVIAAMNGADFIVLVTEPTPFGLHDLKLAHQTVQQLEISCGLVINRANLGDNSVQRYAESNDLPILLEIPFSRTVAELYSRGMLLAEKDTYWRKVFGRLLEKIRRNVVNSEVQA